MTKLQAVKKINAIIKEHQKEMTKEVNDVLTEAGLCYGYIPMLHIVHSGDDEKSFDRNADHLVSDGVFDTRRFKVNDWFHNETEINVVRMR